MMMFLELFIEFFKTGLFAIGGGLATLPFLYDIASKYSWFDSAIMSDMIAISESTPGPIGVNMATYAGFNAGADISLLYGLLGGVLATLSLVLPSLIICIIVANFLERFKESPLVENAFSALRPAVCGLIMAACLNVFKSACLNVDLYMHTKDILNIFNIKALIMFILFFVLIKFTKYHPVFYIIPGALIGILLKM